MISILMCVFTSPMIQSTQQPTTIHPKYSYSSTQIFPLFKFLVKNNRNEPNATPLLLWDVMTTRFIRLCSSHAFEFSTEYISFLNHMRIWGIQLIQMTQNHDQQLGLLLEFIQYTRHGSHKFRNLLSLSEVIQLKYLDLVFYVEYWTKAFQSRLDKLQPSLFNSEINWTKQHHFQFEITKGDIEIMIQNINQFIQENQLQMAIHVWNRVLNDMKEDVEETGNFQLVKLLISLQLMGNNRFKTHEGRDFNVVGNTWMSKFEALTPKDNRKRKSIGHKVPRVKRVKKGTVETADDSSQRITAEDLNDAFKTLKASKNDPVTSRKTESKYSSGIEPIPI
eukprot:NODE_376_length_8513_cov_1.020086.p2 type:complete len:336 gc:universal NODE_376_length_8513_cov_1.020086:5797-4790(-)